MFKKMKSGWVLGILALSLLACAQTGPQSGLTVDMSAPVTYVNENGDHFVAQYGSLSDGSLHFVRVKMPDGQEHTLPQVVSGSGVRYTDERELVWWTHQGTVRVDVRDAQGQWTVQYPELREVEEAP